MPTTSPGLTPERSSAVRAQRQRMSQNRAGSKANSLMKETSGWCRTSYAQPSRCVARRRPSTSKIAHLAPPVPASRTTKAGMASGAQDVGIDDVARASTAQPGLDAVDDQVRLVAEHVARRAPEMGRYEYVR